MRPRVLRDPPSCGGFGQVTRCVCAQMSGAQVNLQTLLPEVRRQLEHLDAIKQEVNELWRHHQVQIQQQASVRRYQDRLQKVQNHPFVLVLEHLQRCHTVPAQRFWFWFCVFQILQDLTSVSELLDSCTLMDLGSDVQTSRLLEHFSQARPHFTVSPGFVPQEPQRTLKNQGKFCPKSEGTGNVAVVAEVFFIAPEALVAMENY